MDDILNSQKGEIMPDDIISEDDIADVSLLDNAPVDSPDAGTDAADKGTEDAADPTKATDQVDDKGDAKSTEAKDPKDPADEAKPAEGDEGQVVDKPVEEKTPEQLREEQNQRAQREYQNRQRTKQTVAQQLDGSFGPKTEEDLIEDGLQPQDAKVEALRQEMAYKEQRTQVAELNAGMQSDAVNAMRDFSIFDPNSKDFDEEYTEMVQQQYWTAARVQTAEVMDPRTGQKTEIVTNADVPLYDFYQSMARIYSRGTSKGAERGQQEMQQMLSRTETPGGSSSTSSAPGSLEELEERLGDVTIT